MNSALSAAARHLRVVDRSAPEEPGSPGRDGGLDGGRGGDDRAPSGERTTPVVGYVVLVPEGTDPTELFTADGTRARFRPLLPAEQPPPVQHPPVRRPPAGGAVADRAASGVSAGALAEASAEASTEADAETFAETFAGTFGGSTSGVHVDPERHTAHVDGRQLNLTYLEFELLAHFVANPHRVHTRSHLVGTLWGYSHVGDGRTVDVHIARLRRKLGRFRETIVTVRRVGYKYEPGRAG